MENKRIKSILFPYMNFAPFVREDLSILVNRYNVLSYSFDSSKSLLRMTISFIKSFWFTLLNILKVDCVYTFFPGYHALFPALLAKCFRKKFIIVIGGFESVSIPSIPYGVIAQNNIYGRVVRFELKLADYILSVDESLLEGMNMYADPNGLGYKTGIHSYISNIKATCKVIPTGYDLNVWRPMNSNERQRAIVTVGNASDVVTFIRKGFDFLIEIAGQMLDTLFYFIGLSGKMLEQAKLSATPNCIFLGFVENKLLPIELSKYKVFAQLSMSEGLPNSLCEAMLCGCIPVGSNVNGIPKAIGDTGFILQEKNLKLAIDIFTQALDADPKLGILARRRISTLFDKRQRELSLYTLIDLL